MFLTSSQTDVISVSSLNRLARELLETALPPCWVEGEISNLTLAASGHAYFSLKDRQAQVRCVMFRNRLSALGFRPREGMQVELRGSVTLYEARGDYQINVEDMREAGQGRLFEAFLRLKAQLEAEGLFDSRYKKALPSFATSVGIITSPAAAALRDVVTTFRRRMPSIKLVLYPALVQGAQAAEQLAQAIRLANQRKEVDVLLLCRGGGSLEDLWAFNEEVLARAIHASELPIVSGVGHETDFTIADFVADRRAATPTASAELLSTDQQVLQRQLEQQRRQLDRALARLLTDKGQRLDYLARRLRHPGDALRQQRQTLQQMQLRLQHSIRLQQQNRYCRTQPLQTRLQQLRPQPGREQQALALHAARLRAAMRQLLNGKQAQSQQLQATLQAISPEAVLARGYAIVQRLDNSVVKDPASLQHGEKLKLQLAAGEALVSVEQQQGTQPQLPF